MIQFWQRSVPITNIYTWRIEVHHILSIIWWFSVDKSATYCKKRSYSFCFLRWFPFLFVPRFSSTRRQLVSFFCSCLVPSFLCLAWIPHILYLCSEVSWNRRHVITLLQAQPTPLTWELMIKKSISFEPLEMFINPPAYLPCPICLFPSRLLISTFNFSEFFE